MDVMARLIADGMLLQSAKGPIPNVADLVAGEPIKGSWWAHPKSHDIFNTLNDLADDPDVVRLRLIRDKITLVHRSLWPALVRLSAHFTPEQLAALREEHTESGAHRVAKMSFADWVPADVVTEGWLLTEHEAWPMLPTCCRNS